MAADIRKHAPLSAWLLSLVATGVAADVLDAAPGGFTVQSSVIVDAQRERAWRTAVAGVGTWWDPGHTISGDAGRLRIDARPQGCFCESLGADDAGVVHMTVTMLSPGVLLRLTGGLGPLGLLGVDGNMTWEFESVSETTTRVTFTYAVGGYRPGGLDAIAQPVDAVIAKALLRLKAEVESGRPVQAE